MPASNAEIARLLRRNAAILRVQGGDRFKVKAYGRAADTIEFLGTPVPAFLAEGGKLEDLPGIGTGISAIVRQILETGLFPGLEANAAALPPELAELSAFPALDPKLALRAYKKLGVTNVADLRGRVESGEVERALGSRAAFRLRIGLAEHPHMLLWKAEPLAATIAEHLRSLPGVSRVSTVGSLRRKNEIVDNLEFAVAARSRVSPRKHLPAIGGAEVWQPDDRSAWRSRLSTGLPIRLQWCDPDEWGLELLLQTGSSAHLDALRAHAKTMGLQISSKQLKARQVNRAEEATIYAALNLAFIPPELREGTGEVEAASNGGVPELVEAKHLRGDLHTHTTSSDGTNTIAEMVSAAQARGYRYIGITDHSQSLRIARGQSEKQLRQQIDDIDAINAGLKDFLVLKSAEVDILEDGKLDYPDSVLRELDYSICSIHSHFRLSKARQTSRIQRAMDNRYFTILGHATGRLLLQREGYEVDFDELVQHARQAGCFFEINSSPNRLDLSAEHARAAKDAGVKIAVNTDAHSIGELRFISAGLNQARRAWLEPKDVLNTLPLASLRKSLRRR